MQKAITELREETLKVACEVADAEDKEAIGKLRAAGWKIPEFSAADKADLRNRLAPVSKEWAEGLDKRGKPGSLVLKTYLEELAKHKK